MEVNRIEPGEERGVEFESGPCGGGARGMRRKAPLLLQADNDSEAKVVEWCVGNHSCDATNQLIQIVNYSGTDC